MKKDGLSRIRTYDRPLRRRMLYPAELSVHDIADMIDHSKTLPIFQEIRFFLVIQKINRNYIRAIFKNIALKNSKYTNPLKNEEKNQLHQ